MAEKDPIAEELRKQYPSKSISPKKHDIPKQEKVISGTAHIVEEKKSDKLKKKFFKANIADIRTYAVNELLLPAVKNIILSTLEMSFFGQASNRPWFGGSNMPTRGYGYSARSTSMAMGRMPSMNEPLAVNRVMTSSARQLQQISTIVFDKYSDVEDLVTTMLDILERYNVVPLDVFYSAAGLPSTAADTAWGWTRFDKLEPKPVPGGYILDVFPSPQPIK